MPLWKQRMFARLMKPIDGEGSDGGGGSSAIETAMDAVGITTETPAETPADTSTDAAPADTTASTTDTDPNAGKDDDTPKPGSRVAAMLDELTDDPNKAKDETPAPAAETKPAEGETKPTETETDRKSVV